MASPRLIAAAVIFGMLTCISLSGCNQTAAQATFANQSTQISQAIAEYKTCRLQVRENAEFATIVKYLSDSDSGQFTIEQLSDEKTPSAEEARVYAKFYDAYSACFSSYIQRLSATRPDTIALLIDSQNSFKKLVLSLVAKRLTWGDFSKRAAEITDNLRKSLAEAGKEYRENLQAENAEELAQRRQAAMLYLHAMQNQQIINSVNRPVITNCNAFGNSMNCISQ